MRLGWIAMYLLYTLSRSIWTLWQCMAIKARSDSLSVVILLLNHMCILLTQENDLSASVLPIGNTARIFSSSLMLGKNKLSVPSAGSSLSIEIVRFQGRTSSHCAWSTFANSDISSDVLTVRTAGISVQSSKCARFSSLKRDCSSAQTVSSSGIATDRFQ